MFLIIHHQTIVDLIGKDDQLMFSGHVHNLLQDLSGVEGSGGVVGVDDYDGFGFVRDFPFDVLHIRIPVGLFIADIVDGFAAGQVCAGSPQRIVR